MSTNKTFACAGVVCGLLWAASADRSAFASPSAASQSTEAAGAAARAAVPAAAASGYVGRVVRLAGVVLPGPELEVALPDGSRSPGSLRIAAVFRHGDAFRYDFEFCGLEPKTFDLRGFLKRKDGSSLAGLPPLDVEVRSRLPPGQVQPHLLAHRPPPSVGGYENFLFLAAAVWVVGLALLVRRRAAKTPAARGEAPPPTLAERLRPAVEEAVAGRIDSHRLADLERMLLAYWRQRLHLEEATAEEALAEIRKHAEGGALLRVLEAWLHAPEQKVDVSLNDLLAPYQHVPAPPGKV